MMADGGNDRRNKSLLLEPSSRRCASYSATASRCCVCADAECFVGRAPGKQLQDGRSHVGGQFPILLRPVPGLAFTPGGAHLLVCETVLFGPLQRTFFHQDTLAFVTTPGAAEANNDG